MRGSSMTGFIGEGNGNSRECLYPIRTVSRLTGVNAVTLRAWERRYGLIKPRRTDSGHRVYTEQHVDEIRHILALVDSGVSIGQVGTVLEGENNAAPASGRENAWD